MMMTMVIPFLLAVVVISMITVITIFLPAGTTVRTDRAYSRRCRPARRRDKGINLWTTGQMFVTGTVP
jgi:hypothetical protein